VIVERGVEADVTAIACPVYSEARIIAALSLVVPSYRLTTPQAARYGQMLGSAADSLSAGLSRRPNSTLPERQS
jgi:DNA-binding IclR family transcriptional regulator